MKVLSALLRAMRPQQWTKNLFVFAPLLFEHRFDMVERNLRAVAAFGVFCCLASGVYLMNDVLDREADRAHPEKRKRPIASGELPAGLAAVVGAALVLGGLAWAHFGLARTELTAVFALYVAIQVAYSTVLKHMVIVDVLCIASGFVLRMLAGALAAWIPNSPWILVVTIFISLFLALCKRRHEVVSLKGVAAAHRPILAEYPPEVLDQLISATAAATLVTYVLYAVDPETVRRHGLVWHGRPAPLLVVTVPFVIYGVFRYLYLVYRREGGGSPTSTLLRDVPLLVNGLLYALAVLAVFRFAPR